MARAEGRWAGAKNTIAKSTGTCQLLPSRQFSTAARVMVSVDSTDAKGMVRQPPGNQGNLCSRFLSIGQDEPGPLAACRQSASFHDHFENRETSLAFKIPLIK